MFNCGYAGEPDCVAWLAVSEAGGHLLTSCKGSYEISEEHDSFNVCHEHFMWDQQNHGACGEPEIKYIPCSSCQKHVP